MESSFSAVANSQCWLCNIAFHLLKGFFVKMTKQNRF
jgi:hypothetical protein